MKLIIHSALILILFFSTGCNNRLIDDVYRHTLKGSDEYAATAFIALSNLALTQDDIKKLEHDYLNEDNLTRKYLYEYLLSKRTQEEKYTLAFIKNSRMNTPLLIKNHSQWISIASPFYKHLSYYSKTNDEALEIIFSLIEDSDGANLAIISLNLNEIRKMDNARFVRIAKNSGVPTSEILMLLENE
ncbi:MAG: hypothetical protein KUG83_07440 [Gammaproteobacteria bacterium]|nr:hypothetical protein [Gammaproteobacteria bacterium]